MVQSTENWHYSLRLSCACVCRVRAFVVCVRLSCKCVCRVRAFVVCVCLLVMNIFDDPGCYAIPGDEYAGP